MTPAMTMAMVAAKEIGRTGGRGGKSQAKEGFRLAAVVAGDRTGLGPIGRLGQEAEATKIGRGTARVPRAAACALGGPMRIGLGVMAIREYLNEMDGNIGEYQLLDYLNAMDGDIVKYQKRDAIEQLAVVTWGIRHTVLRGRHQQGDTAGMATPPQVR